MKVIDPMVSGLMDPEGPVALDDGRWLVVEMHPDRGCVTMIDPTSHSLSLIKRTGRPNGLALAANGDVLVAESSKPALLRLTMDGESRTLLTHDDRGEPFLFPNDLCFGPDGTLYMTDSGIRFEDIVVDGAIREDYETAPYDGRVYRIDVESGRIETIDSGLKFLNGISIGVDGALYTNDTISGDVYRYALDGRSVGERTVFGNVLDRSLPRAFRGPDGMAHDVDGNLYVTVYNQHQVVVLDSSGDVAERIRTTGKSPTNVAFGRDEVRIYVTEGELGQVEVIDVGVLGAAVYRG